VTKISIFYKQIQEQTERAIKANWEFPFIIGFLMLLFATAFRLNVGWISLAEATANFAYFALAVGVTLQMVCFGKNRFKNRSLF